jgi:hypothetical protein
LASILGLVIRGVQVIDARFKAGVHDRQILIGQREVDDMGDAMGTDQRGGGGGIIGVDFGGGDGDAGARLDRFGDGIAFELAAAGQHDRRENVAVHRHLVHCDRTDAACADYQNLIHRKISFGPFAKFGERYRASQ